MCKEISKVKFNEKVYKVNPKVKVQRDCAHGNIAKRKYIINVSCVNIMKAKIRISTSG